MNKLKCFLKTCVLPVLFVCVFAASSLYAQTPFDIEQKVGVGFQLWNSGINMFGVNARFWSEKRLGFEVGWVTNGESGRVGGYSINLRTHMINPSLLVTLAHVDTNNVYIRPYAGGGPNIIYRKSDRDDDLTDYGKEVFVIGTKVGGQGFGGAEVTFKAVPQLSVGGDLGVYRYQNQTGRGLRFLVHYYLK